MADAKTSALPAVAAVVDAQEFPVNDGGTSKKASAAQIKTYTNSGLISGSTGATDNRLLRSDGTGGATAQASPVSVDDSGNVTLPARLLGKQGANVASDTDIVFGSGNYFVITGTTTIESILSTGWTAGSVVWLRFTASVTVAHLGGGGSFDPIHVQGGANLACGSGDTLGLLYDGSDWWQVAYSNI